MKEATSKLLIWHKWCPQAQAARNTIACRFQWLFENLNKVIATPRKTLHHVKELIICVYVASVD
jgi:hypothetical protein